MLLIPTESYMYMYMYTINVRKKAVKYTVSDWKSPKKKIQGPGGIQTQHLLH